MKDVLIVAQYTLVPSSGDMGRFNEIADRLLKNGKEEVKVELVTTNFSHAAKAHVPQGAEGKSDYLYTMLQEPGYKRNVGLQRIYSHHILAKNLRKYLKQRAVPDLIYCAVPSLSYAKVAAQYAKAKRIPFIIDVQDLWPEAFQMVLNIPVITDILFAPMKWSADFIYRQADQVIAVSETYCKRAMSVNIKTQSALSVYLGNSRAKFDSCKPVEHLDVKENQAFGRGESDRVLKNDPVRLVYIGTLGHSYDLIGVLDALKLIKERKGLEIPFLVMGDGPLKQKFEDYAKVQDLPVEFTGRLPYAQMVAQLKRCDIAVNPISYGAAQSIINKVGDYALAGLPIVSTQENEEYRNLLEQYQAGINCENGNTESLAEAILTLTMDCKLRKQMGKNNRRLGEERFDRDVSYQAIVDAIMNMLKED